MSLFNKHSNSTRVNTSSPRAKILTTKPMVLRYSEVSMYCPFRYNYFGETFTPCVSPKHINLRYGYRDGKCHWQRGYWIGSDSVPRINCGYWVLPLPKQPVQLKLF